MNWLSRFLYGRYGNDKLNTVLIVLYFVLAILFAISRMIFLWILSLLLLLLALLRMFSRNIPKRRAENDALMRIWRRIKAFFSRQKLGLKDRAHVYFKCASCGSTLRVPRGAGKIEATCPRCGSKTSKKT